MASHNAINRKQLIAIVLEFLAQDPTDSEIEQFYCSTVLKFTNDSIAEILEQQKFSKNLDF